MKNVRITTDYLFDFKRGEIVDIERFDGTPMEQFFRTRLSENDGTCELVSETNNTEEGTD